MKRLRTYIASATMLLLTCSAHAQKKVSADVEVKQVAQGKVTTVTKSVYCANNGRLVVHFHKPEDYYVLTNTKGETRMYMPRTNEVLSDNSDALSSKDELLSIFMSGRADDLGLALYGYSLQSTVNEDGKIKKTFKSNDSNNPTVEIVFENFLPIYMAYLNGSGKISSKTYFTKYTRTGRFTFPTRNTTISYTGRDSTVTRTVYSNILIDQDAPEFNFEIPAGAKAVSIPMK